MTTEVSRSACSAPSVRARRGVLINEGVYVLPELLEIDVRCASKDLEELVFWDEHATTYRIQFRDGYSVARHDEAFAPVEGAHDLAAVVAQLSLRDVSGHDV